MKVKFNTDVKLSDLLTTISVLLAIATFLTAWVKDRRLRTRQYADRIRGAAANALAAVERWKELSLRLFDDLQPVISDADVALTTSGDVIKTRDSFWRAVVAAQALVRRSALEEKLSLAYVDLYAYEPGVHARYVRTTNAIRQAIDVADQRILQETQADIVSMEGQAKPFRSAALGNRLRETVSRVSKDLTAEFERVTASFDASMLSLVSASDEAIMRKRAHEPVPANSGSQQTPPSRSLG